jgi:phosphatidylglycerol:prolipoprotein diacylglycerol transferase
MVHDLSPFAWRFSESFGVRWYGLSYLLAFFFAFILLLWLSRRQRSGMTVTMISDFVAYAAIGVLVGGRLGYCVFYSPDLFVKFKAEFPYWGALALQDGGMSSHGGMLGLVLAVIFFAWRTGISRLYLFDLAALAGAMGIFFGRIANFVNGELVGRVASSFFPLAVKFPQDILYWPQYSYAKLSSLSSVIAQIPGLKVDEWKNLTSAPAMTGANQDKISQMLSQILDSIQEGNTAAKNAIAPLLEPRHPSQLYAAFGEGLFVFLFLFVLWYKPRRPGVIGAWFLVLYSTVRIIDEQFRLPDAQLGYQWLDLTRGQWLSIGSLMIGLWLLFFYQRSGALPVPGWGLGPNVRIHRRQ